jgi:hypothetical protein
MGKPGDIAHQAIVQIDGVLDDKHVLLANQVATLTGYVTVSDGDR